MNENTDPTLARSVKGAFYQLNAETTQKVERAISNIASRQDDKVASVAAITEGYRVAFNAGFSAAEIEFLVQAEISKPKAVEPWAPGAVEGCPGCGMAYSFFYNVQYHKHGCPDSQVG